MPPRYAPRTRYLARAHETVIPETRPRIVLPDETQRRPLEEPSRDELATAPLAGDVRWHTGQLPAIGDRVSPLP